MEPKIQSGIVQGKSGLAEAGLVWIDSVLPRSVYASVEKIDQQFGQRPEFLPNVQA